MESRQNGRVRYKNSDIAQGMHGKMTGTAEKIPEKTLQVSNKLLPLHYQS
ncbi:MAG: hypothetical protein K2O78_06395 [Muribaculaceae bacterium]|nr:hypothetical protein [Muribaculaceae bacterium]MDE7081265.1 hypothetical protein [Muribaculaceae bacterium]